MNVGFTGTQRGMNLLQEWQLFRVLVRIQIKEFHHGDCVGADSRAHDLVRSHAVCCKLGMLGRVQPRIVIHPPSNPVKRAWKVGDSTLMVKPYLERNHHIVDVTDILIGTPAEEREKLRSGIWATLRYARKRHHPVLVILPSGGIWTDLKILPEIDDLVHINKAPDIWQH